MKNYVLLFIVVFFSSSCFAQKSSNAPVNKKTEKAKPTDKDSKEEVTVVAYDVKETINQKFGGRITTYTVPTLDLVDKNELGPDNTRVVKPKYVKVVAKAETPIVSKLQASAVVNNKTVIQPIKIKEDIPKRRPNFAIIKIIENYERVLEKGYRTEEMLIAVANYHYFAGHLDTAAKWYSQLFEFCPDELDPVYYYRYSKSLESIGQTEKAKEMMVLYQSKKM